MPRRTWDPDGFDNYTGDPYWLVGLNSRRLEDGRITWRKDEGTYVFSGIPWTLNPEELVLLVEKIDTARTWVMAYHPAKFMFTPNESGGYDSSVSGFGGVSADRMRDLVAELGPKEET